MRKKPDKVFRDLGIEPPKTAKQIRRECKDEANSLPLETKKKFWAEMLDGKTVGEARKIAGIADIMVAAELFIQYHKEIHIPMAVDEIK